MLEQYFRNTIIDTKEDITIYTSDDQGVKNFGKQWRDYRNVQIDSINKFSLSKDYLSEITLNDLSDFKNKNILEIGCGAGRFTEYFAKYAKLCVSIDLSDAVFFNVSKNNVNVKLAKANFLDLEAKKKFDIVFCRGVIQHTPDPKQSIKKIHEFVKKNGLVIFDIYKMPKIGLFHPKYLLWRPLIQKLFTYEQFEDFLKKNIYWLLSLKRFLDILFFQKKFFSDCLIPIWDYNKKYKLTKDQLKKLSILDTLDGLYAKYDKPMKYDQVKNILLKNKLHIVKSIKEKNYFCTSV